MLKPEQIASVKGRGFLINRGTECFSAVSSAPGAVFTAADLRTISEIARKIRQRQGDVHLPPVRRDRRHPLRAD